MRVLVTGGAGYVGSHAAKLLAESGHTVVVVDNLAEGHRLAVGRLPIVVADLLDRERLVSQGGRVVVGAARRSGDARTPRRERVLLQADQLADEVGVIEQGQRAALRHGPAHECCRQASVHWLMGPERPPVRASLLMRD